MAKRKQTMPVDFPILFLTLALLAFGLIMILSAGSVRGFNATQNSYFFLTQQLKWMIVGFFCAAAAIIVPYKIWRRFAGLGLFISMALLSAVIFSDSGITGGGSARWINIMGFTVQPSEVAKLSLVLFYAHVLDRYPIQRGKDWRTPFGILIPVTLLILALVYKQPDLGTTLVLASVCAVLLLQTEIPTILFVAAIPTFGVPLVYFVQKTTYQWNRILVWLDPWKDPINLGYQITNAEIAFGSGGLLGVGLGRSMQKYGFLPESHTDMIFAIVGEELGLIGAMLLISLFITLYARAYYVIGQCPDRFGRLLGYGLISTLAIQTTVNLAVVTGVFPVTGITLPLISYGGNSLVITMVQLGLILNISRYRKIVPKPTMTKNPQNLTV